MADESTRDNMGSSDLLRMTTEVVAAYLGNNSVQASQISEVISTVHHALINLSSDVREPEPEPLRPAVPIKKSVTPEFIICLEDGKQLKMLKRHLRTTYDMTPEEYRAKWGLPASYPMVAPNYAKQRSEFAKKIGLGKVSAKPAGRRKKTA
jgi:predicted transcriptional regulator